MGVRGLSEKCFPTALSVVVIRSPAKVRVSRYVKGDGPEVVRVVTGVVSANFVNAEGIEPQAGQRWFI